MIVGDGYPTRYSFNLRRGYVWRDMLKWRPFWKMWGIRKTLWFMANDTLQDAHKAVIERGRNGKEAS